MEKVKTYLIAALAALFVAGVAAMFVYLGTRPSEEEKSYQKLHNSLVALADARGGR